MQSFPVRLVSILLVPAILFLTITYAKAGPSAEQVTQVDQLAAACLAAKTDFHPLTKADLQQAKTEMLAAVDRLDRKLDSADENGMAWRQYLQWDRLQAQLRRDEPPELPVLDENYKRYAAGHEGLDLIWFLEVRQAIRQYLIVARAIDNPQLEAGYAQLLDRLANDLKAYAAKSTTEKALIISDALHWLEDAQQAPALVRAVQDHFGSPNLLMMASAELVAAGIAGPVDDTAPVRDVILGTTIHGTGHTTGQNSVKLVPDSSLAVIDVIFLGITKTRNTGYNGPVRIFSNGTTRTGACKRFWLDATGFASLPAVSNAITETTINDIRSNRGRRIVEKMAWKRTFEKKAPFESFLVDLLGELPERLQADGDEEPWTIAFARRRPISVTFADNGFNVTIRGRRYYQGDNAHPGMDVTAVYKIEKSDQTFKAVRQGKLQIYPPGFVPDSGKRISARQVVIRTLLQRRFDTIFEEEIIMDDVVLPGEWEKAGKMRPVQLLCRDGWLTAAWKKVPADQPTAPAQ
jgi:hypothetical protein